MHIGYLHLTQFSQTPGNVPVSGVTRYGQHLANAAKATMAVTEITMPLADMPTCLVPKRLEPKGLEAVDGLHVQYSQFLWRPELVDFIQQLNVPIVVTLHDVHRHLYPPGNWLQLFWQENQRQRALSKGNTLSVRSTWRQTQQYRQQRQSLQAVMDMANVVLTCHHYEKEQLAHFKGQKAIQVIPHFVEMRSHLPPTPLAKHKLGLDPKTLVLTLQGYIYRTKGHEIALHALAQLPGFIHMVFAGGPSNGNESFVRELQILAQELDLTHRVRITGYLCDQDLDLYLAATDLAICPFQTVSASGSLSTWIAAGKPILASDLPQIQDYNQLVEQDASNAISTFSPHTPTALADAIQTCLDSPGITNVEGLQQKLKLSTIIEAHRNIYTQLL